MIADTLLNWEKAELANILADKMADAEDLVEAFPAIEKASFIEESILEDFIQINWKLILTGFDADELLEWIEERTTRKNGSAGGMNVSKRNTNMPNI